jgi:hypothetical protein
MSPRYALLNVVLAFAITSVIGGAVFGFLGATYFVTSSTALVALAADALSYVLRWAVTFVLFGATAGVLGWLAMFAAGRDGWHRMETVAFVPRDYLGASRSRAQL